MIFLQNILLYLFSSNISKMTHDSSEHHVDLNDGTSIPVVGFGAGMSCPLKPLTLTIGTALYQKESIKLIKQALSTGYRYLDGAQQYGNSESIGTALKESGIDRKDVYILTKCEEMKGFG